MRGSRKNLFRFARRACGRIVENRNTRKFGNSFFEKLQPLTGYFTGEICNTSDVATGTGKAFNYARLDWIDPATCHNEGNRLGRIHGRPDHSVSSCYHDDFNLETHQLGHKLREPVNFSLRVFVLYGYALSLYVAKVTQSLPK